MSDRSKLLRLAASLPVGAPERREILSSLAKEGSGLQYKRDGNVSLTALIYNLEKDFAEDVAKGVLRYTALRTPLEGKGATHLNRGSAYGSLYAPALDVNFGVEVSVVTGKHVLVKLYDQDKVVKKLRYPLHDTPASIGSDAGSYGLDIITKGTGRL